MYVGVKKVKLPHAPWRFVTQGRDENETPEEPQSSCEQRHISCWGHKALSGVLEAVQKGFKVRTVKDTYSFNLSFQSKRWSFYKLTCVS